MAVGWYFHSDVNFNRTEACRRAGYKQPDKQASVVFHRPAVVAEVERRRVEISQEFKVGAAEILLELQKLAFFNLGDYGEIDPINGDFLINLSDVNRDQMAALGSIEVEVRMEGKGEDAREVKKIRIKAPDKLGALDRLARHYGLLSDSMNVNVSTDLAAQIIAAKKRLKEINNE